MQTRKGRDIWIYTSKKQLLNNKKINTHLSFITEKADLKNFVLKQNQNIELFKLLVLFR